MPNPNPTDQSDAELLNHFVRERDDAAFAELVRRYAGLVYGVAIRRAGRPAADEVVQNVFATFARKAGSLDAAHGLGAWLHTVAVRVSANATRKEQRRNRAMKRYAETLDDTEPAPDADLLPLLDEALDKLPGGERQLIFMRFFESLSFREIGQRLGASEEAGRKRVCRTLEKLAKSVHLRAGRAVPIASLSTLLGASLKTQAPASVVVAAAASPPVAVSAIGSLTIMKTSQVVFASSLALAAAIPVGVQWRALASAPERDEPVAASATIAEPAALGNGPVLAPAAFQTEDRLDLDKLAAALAQIDEKGEPADLVFDLTAQMFALGAADIPAVGDLLVNSANPNGLYPLIAPYFTRWAEFDPQAALTETGAERWEGMMGGALLRVVGVWGAADPEAAVAWCEEQGDDRRGRILKKYVYQRWVISDPHEALAKTREVPDERGGVYRVDLVRTWSRHDARSAMKWVHGVEDEAERSTLAWTVIESTSWDDAATAFELARELEEPVLRAKSLEFALGRWRFEPEPSVRAFLSLPEAARTPDLAKSVLEGSRHPDLDQKTEPADAEEALREWIEAREENSE